MTQGSQAVRHRAHNPGTVGSTPTPATIAPIVQGEDPGHTGNAGSTPARGRLLVYSTPGGKRPFAAIQAPNISNTPSLRPWLTMDPEELFAPPQPKTGFACDTCGGKHLKVALCTRCGAWNCPDHSVPVTHRDEYDNYQRTTHTCSKSKACDARAGRR